LIQAYESIAATLWAGRLDKIMATRKRHSPEQIVRKLMAADHLLAEGHRGGLPRIGLSEATYHRWRNQFGELKAEDAKRLKDLERENATLKRLLADAELEKDALGESPREISRPGTPAGSRSSPPACAGGQRAVRLPRHRAAPRHPTPRTRLGDARRSGRRPCRSGYGATPRSILAAVSGRPTTTPAARAGK
jgi:hypothetical protein